MEVHRHPEPARKGFKGYFLEFLISHQFEHVTMDPFPALSERERRFIASYYRIQTSADAILFMETMNNPNSNLVSFVEEE
ncbi:MAG TPA: hypothetical protein VKR32_03480 [Puia sp.]|nr:hypothetical protein [Puia sp.]